MSTKLGFYNLTRQYFGPEAYWKVIKIPDVYKIILGYVSAATISTLNETGTKPETPLVARVERWCTYCCLSQGKKTVRTKIIYSQVAHFNPQSEKNVIFALEMLSA